MHPSSDLVIRGRSTNVTVSKVSADVGAGLIHVTPLEKDDRLAVSFLGTPKPETAPSISDWLRETNSILVKMRRSQWKFRHSPREMRKAELRETECQAQGLRLGV